jgi:hypothetical protein
MLEEWFSCKPAGKSSRKSKLIHAGRIETRWRHWAGIFTYDHGNWVEGIWIFGAEYSPAVRARWLTDPG